MRMLVTYPALAYLLILALGLILGSFINAWVIRTKGGKSVATGRSECPQCHKQLKWYDNIPLLSFALLKGKCRACNKPISWQYPIVELATGILFAGLYWHFQPITMLSWVNLTFWLLISVLLICAFVYDLRWMLLPDKFMLPAILLGGLIFGLKVYQSGWSANIASLEATLIFTLVFLALWFFSKGRFLGEGDIRLAIIMGLVLGVPQLLVGIFAAYVAGAGIGVILILLKQKKRTSKIAFGPFLIAGLYFGLFFGSQIADWYLNLL